ncbi:MAG: VCBS repeat-containing protein [Verrucomicrobiales bacterium]
MRSTLKWKLAAGIILFTCGLLIYRGLSSKNRLGEDGKLVRRVVSSEELILELTPQLDRIALGMMNLQFPAKQDGTGIFAESVRVVDLAAEDKLGELPKLTNLVKKSTFPVEKTQKNTSAAELALWRPVIDEVSYFDHVGFGFVKGAFIGDALSTFQATVKVSGLARRLDGHWMSLSGKQIVTWTRDQSGVWRISGWEMKGLEATTSGQLMFSETLDQAVPREGDRFRARQNWHQQEAVRYYKTNKTQAPTVYFAPIAMNQKPAISVVDINGDGFDDLYVMVRIGKNLLFVNRGDGTFAEQSVPFELAVPGNSTCGLFADFDNDGDADLMLGRSVERCMYLENAGGWFVEKSMDDALPFLASSMSAADYNGDGLLDVYISTYRPEVLGGGTSPTGGTGTMEKTWPEDFFTPEQAKEFRERFAKTKKGGSKYGSLLEQVGPPNVLLVNKGGGKFERAPENPQLELWANSLQATWADIDEDGDPDLYVANDWARDYLFRNDGDKGFTDIANESGANVFGFAMGASWGDYNNDGRQDLYVSNMFSKAGHRIMEQIDGLDPNYRVSAEGNYLYEHLEGDKFKRVSGLEKPALLVASAGWSWGGQFVDFDNDADLDIYAMSGYFTAPPEVASDLDL